jgi:hypothetical protein
MQQLTLQTRIYFSQTPYPIYLGLLIKVWTSFISEASSQNIKLRHAPLFTSIFPGRDTGCHVLLHENSDSDARFRTPLHYKYPMSLPGLMNLHSFLAGGNEVPEAKFLVCVKSVTGRKTIKTKHGDRDLYEAVLHDESAECVLKLWGSVGSSTKIWQAGKTILLISQPGEKAEFRGSMSISLSDASTVDVEPEFADARWLRRWVEKHRKEEGMKQEWPENIWSLDDILEKNWRVFTSLGEVDEWFVDQMSSTLPFLQLTHATAFVKVASDHLQVP